ncbi:MAG: DUF4405 domain-containing protein [bacterium]
MTKVDRKFNVRAFVALMMTFTGVGLPPTGLANHFHEFTALSVARHAWMSAHNVLGLLFTVFTVWHVILNRRGLWKHLNGPSGHTPEARREALIAGAVVAVVLLIFVGHAFHAGAPR